MSDKKSIILVGGGGHCKAVIDIIESLDLFNIKGIIDKKENVGKKILDHPIIGCDDDIPDFIDKYTSFIISMGHPNLVERRILLYNTISKLGGSFPVIVSPFSFISKYANIESGTIIMHNVSVIAGSSIGKNCIIGSNSCLNHDSIVKDHSIIKSGSSIFTSL